MASPPNLESIQIALVSNVPYRVQKFSTRFQQSTGDDLFDLHAINGDVDQIPPSQPFQCLIIDLEGFPNPLNLIRQIHHSRPSLGVIVIDAECTCDHIVNAVSAGVRGCIDPDCDSSTARQAVKNVLNGLFWFSPQVMSKVIFRLLETRRPQG